MDSYSPVIRLLRIKYIIQKGYNSDDEEICKMSKEILDIIPNEINFIIKNNIAVSTKKYVNNNMPISELLCCEGINDCHYFN